MKIKGGYMSESAILALFDVIIKVLPSCVSFIEGLVGDGGSIAPEHVSQIFSHMADISKDAAALPDAGSDVADSVDAIQSVGSEPHAL